MASHLSRNWTDEIARAVEAPDPVLSNRKITRVHYLLSLALQDVTGGIEAGANFHSWAVWGSRKAGVTIRQQDLDSALRDATVVAGGVGLAVGRAVGAAINGSIPVGRWGNLAATAVGGLSGGWTGRCIAAHSRREASRLILAGNRTVLEDIGTQTARFIDIFADEPTPNPFRFVEFVGSFREGPTEQGGQDLLRRAFTQYHRARYAGSVKERQEAMYFGNCLAVLHEHIRLQPYIKDSMPWIIRKCVTKRMMSFDVGGVRLAVSEEILPLTGAEGFPENLRDLDDDGLNVFLHGPDGWDRGMGTSGSIRAADWTLIHERMGYIVNLFRALHLDPAVMAAPYGAGEMDAIGG